MVTDNNFISKFKYYLNDPYVKLLLIILFIGFLIRVWGIWNIEQTDEFNEVFEALKVDSGRLNLERWNKKVLIYILALEYGIYFCVGWIVGIFSSVSDFASEIVLDMFPLFIIGRVTSAVFGTLIIFLTYKIGAFLFDKRIGLLSSLLICFNLVHVEHSHLVLVDITMTLALVCSFFFATKMAYFGSRGSYFLGGFFAGLAIVAKIPSVFIFLSLITAHVMACYQEGNAITSISAQKHIAILLIGVSCGMILGSPGILFAPVQYFKYLLGLIGAYEGTADEIPYFTPGNGYLFYFKSMVRNMGLPVMLCSLFGIFALRNHWKKLILLLSFPLPFYLFMSHSKWFVADRYLIPIYPFLAIFASMFVISVLGRFKKQWLAPIVGAALIIIPAIKIAYFELSLTRQNTRYWAKEWIEENIPPGSKILIDSGRTINTYSPPIWDSRENVLRMLNKVESLPANETFDDSRIVDAKSSTYFEHLLAHLPTPNYHLTSTELGTNVETPDYYRQHAYDYIITSSYISWQAYVDKWKNKYPRAADFYQSLDKQFEVLKEFRASSTRAGPKIVIYKIE